MSLLPQVLVHSTREFDVRLEKVMSNVLIKALSYQQGVNIMGVNVNIGVGVRLHLGCSREPQGTSLHLPRLFI